jgi:protein MAK11
MAKRKRQAGPVAETVAPEAVANKKQKAVETTTSTAPSKATTAVPSQYNETIQVVVGSYDRVLHGLTASISVKGKDSTEKKNKKQGKVEVDFADTFLFTAHSSAIRCVAISPPSAPTPGQSQKLFLASGATDERINIYELSAHPPKKQEQDALSQVTPRPILENRKNRELGSLMHHASTVTALRFPTRSKLLSSSDDSTIAVTRTRDWSLLSNIKAPIPVAQGRPSGDTAPFGGTPAGVTDFAIHPSMKLMLSVSKGERSMRLWNLMTGKRAGVLNFDRALLQEIGEGKHSAAGEGRRVIWGSVDGADEFAVGFERDVVVFGMDSVPKCKVVGAAARTKVHQTTYISTDEEDGPTLLALSTEDGRIMFFSTKDEHIEPAEEGSKASLGTARLVGQIGGADDGVTGRIKEFAVIRSKSNPSLLYVISGSSDGKVRFWTVDWDALVAASEKVPSKEQAKEKQKQPAVGTLVGTYETQNRITCMAAYLMIPRPEGEEDSEDEINEDEESASEEDSDDE